MSRDLQVRKRAPLHPVRGRNAAGRALLVCGILSSLLYAAMLVVVPIQDASYSSISQTVSELSAIGAPTRSYGSRWASSGHCCTRPSGGVSGDRQEGTAGFASRGA
jgi:hypothetical protein